MLPRYCPAHTPTSNRHRPHDGTRHSWIDYDAEIADLEKRLLATTTLRFEELQAFYDSDQMINPAAHIAQLDNEQDQLLERARDTASKVSSAQSTISRYEAEHGSR